MGWGHTAWKSFIPNFNSADNCQRHHTAPNIFHATYARYNGGSCTGRVDHHGSMQAKVHGKFGGDGTGQGSAEGVGAGILAAISCARVIKYYIVVQ